MLAQISWHVSLCTPQNEVGPGCRTGGRPKSLETHGFRFCTSLSWSQQAGACCCDTSNRDTKAPLQSPLAHTVAQSQARCHLPPNKPRLLGKQFNRSFKSFRCSHLVMGLTCSQTRFPTQPPCNRQVSPSHPRHGLQTSPNRVLCTWRARFQGAGSPAGPLNHPHLGPQPGSWPLGQKAPQSMLPGRGR